MNEMTSEVLGGGGGGDVAYLRKGCYEKNQTREMYRFCKFDAFVIHILP